MNEYKILAKDYDLLNPKEEIFKQESFFRKLIAKYSVETCLDSACGTGWHLYMLKKLGLECFGSDLSEEMTALAKRNLKKSFIPIKKEDFRNLSRSWKNQQFDMIVCMTTSLPHMLTDEDVTRALNSMHDQLKDGGILVISNGISDALLDAKPKFIPARILDEVVYYFFLEYPSKAELIFNILQVKKTRSSFKHACDTVRYNAMRKSTLNKNLKKAKFRNTKYYGDFDFSQYSTKKSKRLIVVAEK